MSTYWASPTSVAEAVFFCFVLQVPECENHSLSLCGMAPCLQIPARNHAPIQMV